MSRRSGYGFAGTLTHRLPAAFAAVLLAAVLLLIDTMAADATGRHSRTQFDRIRDCEQLGRQQFTRRDPEFRRFVIDRATVSREPYGARLGGRFVAAIYHGRALYEVADETLVTRFVCLHGGVGRRAMFVDRLPDLD